MRDEFLERGEGWKHYHHDNERTLALTDSEKDPPRTRERFEEMQSRPFVDFVAKPAASRA